MNCRVLVSLVLIAIGATASSNAGAIFNVEDLKEWVRDEIVKHGRKYENEHVRSKRLVLDDEDLYQRVQKLEATIVQLQSIGSGSTYTRWGRTDCPSNGTELVYKGYAAGDHFTHTGGGVNYLCLPETHIYDHVVDGVQSGSYVYGAEYELGGNNIMKGLSKKSL